MTTAEDHPGLAVAREHATAPLSAEAVQWLAEQVGYEPPVDDEPQGDAPANPPLRRIQLTPASAIKPKPVVWAWEESGEGRIPAGSITIAAGREGTGKSSFGLWMAANITRGALPGSFCGTPRPVFYVAIEDSWSTRLCRDSWLQTRTSTWCTGATSPPQATTT